MRIAVCDDTKSCLEQVSDIISKWKNCPENIHTEFFEDGDALIKAHFAAPFDIILLDVIMPLLSGIETAAEIRQSDKNVKIIFLTSSSEYAVDSYSVKASNYILKPVVPEKLLNCLDEIYDELKNSSAGIIIKSGTTFHTVKQEEIEYIEAQNKKVVFFLSGARTLTTAEPMYAFEDKLLLKDGFFKTGRSYIVNIHHISSFTQKEITLRSGYKIPLSRSCHKQFEEAYFSLLFGKAGEN